MLIKSLVATLALCHTTQAAFFWYPEYRCIEDHVCAPSNSKRSDAATVELNLGLIGFEVAQKVPEVRSNCKKICMP
jgi:hypothetical protein